MIVRIAFLFSISILIACCLGGCNQKPLASAESPKKAVQLSKSTAVNLILLKELEAGKSAEGDVVPLMVIDDVKGPGGDVVIGKGTLAYGKVTWSRGEDLLSGLSNRPARLSLTVDRTTATDNTEVTLTADMQMRPGEALQLDRGNTGNSTLSTAIETAWKDPSSQSTLNELNQLFATGTVPESLKSGDANERLKKLSEQLQTKGILNLTTQGKVSDAIELVKGINGTSPQLDMKGGSGLETLAAFVEMASIAGTVGDKLSRMLKGRTIRAHIGTPIKAYVSETVTVVPKPAS